jgi:hypothetical protein
MSDGCGVVERGEDRWKNLRIGAIFILLVTSLCGTLAPILAKRTWRIPAPAFDFVKFFGSGVIVSVVFFLRRKMVEYSFPLHPFTYERIDRDRIYTPFGTCV